MEFKEFNKLLQDNFAQITKNTTHLFEVEVDKDELWDLYLDSFPEGTNKLYRERREYDCSCCRHFVKSFGNVVVIENNIAKSIWDFNVGDTTFQPVLDALKDYINSRLVKDVFISKEDKIGTAHNFEHLDDGAVLEWDHFNIILNDKFVDRDYRSAGDLKGSFRDTRNVFKRSLTEITQERVETVLELISQNSLYKGEEWEQALNEFLKHKISFESLEDQQLKENYVWEKSVSVGAVIGRIKNHSIGTLLTNISEGMDLDTAVRKYESIVAPENYKRPKAIFTKKMLEEAKNTITELGYMNSLNRRFSTLDDITVNNILFSNKDSSKRIEGADIFGEMSSEIGINPKKFSKVEEVSINDFVNNIMPSAKELEVFFDNKHAKNMVSLIAPEDKNAKNMFKWNNGFGWAYTGNITDSSMKENVKSAGGKVDGVLRFSIQWNDIERDENDLDAHCIEPKGYEICYLDKCHRATTGQLDVDIIEPSNKVAVENITWTNKTAMQEGTYKFFVHNYSQRGGRSGFRAEIEFEGRIFTFDYSKELKHKENVHVAEVTFDRVHGFTIKEKLPSNASSREVWGLNTNQFVPVSTVMYSPNYWDQQDNIGHRHYFFMLKDCINPEKPNGFYNEFLKQELVQHKRVLEALGGKMAVQDVDDQLSGVGFSSTKRDDVLVKVIGSTERVVKIKF